MKIRQNSGNLDVAAFKRRTSPFIGI